MYLTCFLIFILLFKASDHFIIRRRQFQEQFVSLNSMNEFVDLASEALDDDSAFELMKQKGIGIMCKKGFEIDNFNLKALHIYLCDQVEKVDLEKSPETFFETMPKIEEKTILDEIENRTILNSQNKGIVENMVKTVSGMIHKEESNLKIGTMKRGRRRKRQDPEMGTKISESARKTHQRICLWLVVALIVAGVVAGCVLVPKLLHH